MAADPDWAEVLAEEFQWTDEEPGPEQVVDEARRSGIDSVEHLIERMKDAPRAIPDNALQALDITDVTGYMRWKWYRGYRDAFLESTYERDEL